MSPDRSRMLVIDNEVENLDFLPRALAGQGVEVSMAGSGPDGIERYQAESFDVVLLDLFMPEMDGFEVLDRLRAWDPEVLAIIMTGYGSIESVVQAMKAGAADYLTKPLDLDHLEIVLHKVLTGRQQAAELRLLKEQLVRQGSFEGLVGVSPGMQQVYGLIRRLAPSDTTVLIQGETGTGKELVARAVHHLSPRREKGFMVFCKQVFDNLM